jgi:flagellar biosynthesis/type III secretory pathway protein FliH
MSFDEKLRQSFDSFTDQLREEARRRLASLTDELGNSYEHEKVALVKKTEEDARRTFDQEIAARVATEVAAVEARTAEAVSAAEKRAEESGRETGHKHGLEEGRAAVEDARKTALEEGKTIGIEEGKKLGLDEGRKAGLEAGRREGEESGRQKGREEGFREGREDGLTEGRQAGIVEGRQEGFKSLAVTERLIESVRAIDRSKSLTEVLDALVASAGSQARRAAVLLLRGGQLRGWKFVGFGPALDSRNDVDVPASDAGVIAEAARTGSPVAADSNAPGQAPAFASLPPGREVLAVPVAMSGQIVAVLYADQGLADSGEQPGPWPAIVEVLALHAARCLESITAFRAAKALAERPETSTRPAAAAGAAGDKEDPIEAARRYARLVVSEIKLYHENAVIAGRKERDLTSRLGGEITRARTLYEQRVPADVRSRHDYFEDELVKTLAGGDSALIKVRS